MSIFDFLAPRGRCVYYGCTNRVKGRRVLCTEHQLRQDEKIARIVERVMRERHDRPSSLSSSGSDA